MTSAAHVVGRDRELALINRGLATVTGGHGWFAVIEGAPGIGKTRLLAAATSAAARCGFAVLHAAGYEIGHESPFAAIAEALQLRSSSPDRDRAAIADLLRAPAARGRNLEFRLLEDVLALVERLSLERPVLLAVDDLQWVDSPSLLTLAHVVRHLEPLQVAVIAAVRTSDRKDQVERFLRSAAGATRWLVLGPLPDDAVRSLVGELVGGEPGAGLLRLMAGAAGSPLMVQELARALQQDGRLALVDGVVEVTGPSLPSSFLRLVDRRLASVPSATADLLRKASVLGSDFSVALLADFAGRPAGEVATALEPALREGLLGEMGDHLAFGHQLVRDAVYEQMPVAVRSALHRQVGRLLALAGAGAAQVASHLALGGDEGRSEAVTWLVRAAAQAASASPMQAVELLDRAGELAGTRHPARDEILVERALALVWAGGAEQGLGAVRAMLAAGVAPPLEERLHLGLAQALLVQGRWEESVQEFEGLSARRTTPDAERARLLADCALAHAHCGELGRAVALADEARRMGEALGDDLARSIALSSLSVAAHFQARHLDSVADSRQALDLARRCGRPDAWLRPTGLWLGLGLLDADRFDEALTVLQTWRRHSEDAGMQWQLPLYDDGIATLHFYAGDWDDAVTEMETCMTLAERTGTLWWLVPANCMLAYIAIHRGQDRAAAAAIATAERHARSARDFAANRLLWAGGLLHEARGDVGRALAALEGAWETTSAGHFLPHVLIIGPDLVRVAVAAGATSRAREVAERVEEVAARTGVPSAAALGQRCRGLAEDDAERLLGAVAGLREGPRRVEQAFASEDAGACLARRGRVSEAVGLLDEALAVYRRLGARRDGARVVAALRRLGARRSLAGHAARPGLGWEALTPTEARVAELASTGLTNPEIGARLFVSRRTIATHLSHVFEKLQISSRVELARLAEERRQRPQAGPGHVGRDRLAGR